MNKITNRPKTVKVKNRTVTKSNSIKFNTYEGNVEICDKGFRVYPFKSIPDLYVQFDEQGEFIYQNKFKDENEKSVEWYIPL